MEAMLAELDAAGAQFATLHLASAIESLRAPGDGKFG